MLDRLVPEQFQTVLPEELRPGCGERAAAVLASLEGELGEPGEQVGQNGAVLGEGYRSLVCGVGVGHLPGTSRVDNFQCFLNIELLA